MAARKLVAGAVAGPLMVGSVLALTASPAIAASDHITAPDDHAVVTDGETVTIKAEPPGLQGGKLQLRRPGSDEFHTVDESGWGHELRYELNVSCSHGCSRGGPAVNGAYTVRLISDGLLTGSKESQSFALRVPPGKPTDVSARALSATAAVVQWDEGDEPDLSAYDVLNSSGSKLKRVSADHACDGGRCSTRVSVPRSKAGKHAGFAVRARRSVEPGSASTLASTVSEKAGASLPALPDAAPMSAGGDDRNGGGSSSPKRSRGAPSPTLRAPDLSGRPSTKSAPMPGLRPLASSSRLALPDIAKGSGRTFERRLDYPAPGLPTPRGEASSSPGSGSQAQPGSEARSMTQPFMPPSQWWKTVALGLVLLLVAAHLGAWTWRTRPEPPRLGGSGKSRSRGGAAGEGGDDSEAGRSQRSGSASGYRGRRRAL